ncbi:uncharacterized protein LTHEOB_5490 [Lasiodiplodia theobromae]|uniref:uncharacterized protein n=1 Tax=Lasiodiplodia theobromae TaxID=45133 RepID=UPI0015C400E6|nr:uncharacterized protein LTHEOB_5490 [Lasiodiplodia theobromae]KAF4545079.1 hypothetical protein LTHEOB_5490 [Lasiodiplodia theobromae]
MRPQQLLAAALTLSSLSAAWPWPPNMDDMKEVMGVENLFKRENWFYIRADETTTSDSAAKTTAAKTTAAKTDAASDTASASGSEKTTAAETASKTDSAAATTGSGTNTAKETGKTTGKESGTAKETGSTKTSKKGSKSTSYDARLPAGGISMITPAATDTSQYYKIGDWLSFAWNYTSLSATPSAINVLASCSLNSETYTLAQNLSVATTNMVYWDTGDYEKTATKSLVQATYTLIIYDAGSSISATAAAGYLGVANTFTFGMYRPQEYVPRQDWTCPGCNAAGVSVEQQTVRFLFGTFAVTVISFTWFVIGFGII